MSLFDTVLSYIKSAGHAVGSAEHELLNEFTLYLGSDKVVSGFSSDPVVKAFAASLVPAPEPVQVAPVADDPVEPTPVAAVDPVAEVPAETTISKETVLEKVEESVEKLIETVKEVL